MQTKDVISKLRRAHNLSQEALAERLFVTRQAVSRWENGETVPNIETLKQLSVLFDVSVNTLLGSPRQLICQCCGMPMQDDVLSREEDGALNESYCRWCYEGGRFVYTELDKLIDVCAAHMAGGAWSEEQIRGYLRETLPQLDYWRGKKPQEK